ncbi:uncharacterized protein LOC101846872 [Aplysia californica]|uniref:Uncharacterized protein LOC101846872 n=1 Tax=Aplysia californica TaxID=6500 RepID=A0ABM0JJR5_APLCA|nr:uncharacterized protein LOC101846872 [Aplysia californica]
MVVPLKEDWQLIASNFEHRWHFPHCLGVIDGKHVVIRAPRNSGSLYRNYKGTFSIVLLALVNAHLHFICIDVGSFERNSDGEIISHSNFGKLLAADSLDLPEDSSLPGAPHLGPMPYVFVGDEAFPLKKHIRPFPGKTCPIQQQIFNYRLSRARRVVENVFGLLAERWRIFHTKIDARPRLVVDITKAACVLHNMLQSQSTPIEVMSLLEEQKGSDRPQHFLHIQSGAKELGIRQWN